MSLLANFLTTAIEYLSPPPSPLATPNTPNNNTPLPVTFSLSRSSSTAFSSTPLKERLDAACQSPTSTLAHLSPPSMRRELDASKHDLARAHSDTTRLEERCKMLEKTLKDTRELLRTREAEIEKLRRDRDRERALGERRKSTPQLQSQSGSGYHIPGAGSRHVHTPPNGSLGGGKLVYPRNGSSLDTKLSSGELARQMHSNGNRMLLQEEDARSQRSSPSRNLTPSPSHTSTASTASASTSFSSSIASSIDVSPTPSQQNNTNGGLGEDRARIRSSETYMSRIDTWSGAQVLQAVHDINSEILQFAASATEMCTFSIPSSSSSIPNTNGNPRPSQAMQDTTTRIGPNMTRILASRDHSQDPLLVQLALQGCVSLCIARALSSFCIGFPSKSDAVLAQIYSHMHLSEPQPTSAKWRALTHSHIHSIYPTLTEYSINELSDTILRWSADIFLVANYQSFSPPSPSVSTSSLALSSSPVSVSSSPPRTRHNYANVQPMPAPTTNGTLALLRTLYLDQIKRISRSVLRLAKVTREEIMSTAFEVVVADPTQVFVDANTSGTDGMVDAFGEYGESSGRVLATMELGLRCVTRAGEVKGEGGNSNGNANGNKNGNGGANGAEGGEARFEQRMLLQPKVVLESILEVLDR